ncbi:hypothetical protein V3C99_016938 [Haemonchus contortus]
MESTLLLVLITITITAIHSQAQFLPFPGLNTFTIPNNWNQGLPGLQIPNNGFNNNGWNPQGGQGTTTAPNNGQNNWNRPGQGPNNNRNGQQQQQQQPNGPGKGGNNWNGQRNEGPQNGPGTGGNNNWNGQQQQQPNTPNQGQQFQFQPNQQMPNLLGFIQKTIVAQEVPVKCRNIAGAPIPVFSG